MSDVILTDAAAGGALVTMHRPEARNALDSGLRQAVPRTLRELDDGRSAAMRVVILTGADPAFCAGLDLKELGTSTLAADREAIQALGRAQQG